MKKKEKKKTKGANIKRMMELNSEHIKYNFLSLHAFIYALMQEKGFKGKAKCGLYDKKAWQC